MMEFDGDWMSFEAGFVELQNGLYQHLTIGPPARHNRSYGHRFTVPAISVRIECGADSEIDPEFIEWRCFAGKTV